MVRFLTPYMKIKKYSYQLQVDKNIGMKCQIQAFLDDKIRNNISVKSHLNGQVEENDEYMIVNQKNEDDI